MPRRTVLHPGNFLTRQTDVGPFGPTCICKCCTGKTAARTTIQALFGRFPAIPNTCSIKSISKPLAGPTGQAEPAFKCNSPGCPYGSLDFYGCIVDRVGRPVFVCHNGGCRFGSVRWQAKTNAARSAYGNRVAIVTGPMAAQQTGIARERL